MAVLHIRSSPVPRPPGNHARRRLDAFRRSRLGPERLPLAAQPFARPLLGLRPRDTLNPVVVAGQPSQLAQFVDRAIRLQRDERNLHRGRVHLLLQQQVRELVPLLVHEEDPNAHDATTRDRGIQDEVNLAGVFTPLRRELKRIEVLG